MIETSAEIAKLAAALHKAQGLMTGVKRDASNPHFKNRYATFENVVDTARPALQEAGIAWVQAPGTITEGGLEVTTMLVHAETGQWMRSTLHVPLQKRDAQGVGSATTYGLRYSLMAMLGLPPTDDDGEAAGAHNNQIRRPPSPPKPTNGDVRQMVQQHPDRPTDDPAKQELYESFESAIRLCANVEQMKECAEEYGVTTADPVIAEIVKARSREFKTNGAHR